MVVDGMGIKHADDAMLQRYVGNGEQEWGPILVESDEADHDEEVEVPLGHAPGLVHEHRRRHEQAEGGVCGPDRTRAGRDVSEHSHD